MEQWKDVKAQGQIQTRPQPDPEALMQLLQCPKRVRVTFGGAVIVDSTNVLMLRERGHLPVYYFPMRDVRSEYLQATEHHTH